MDKFTDVNIPAGLFLTYLMFYKASLNINNRQQTGWTRQSELLRMVVVKCKKKLCQLQYKKSSIFSPYQKR